ncbi:glycosyl hydrolase family 28-related protein (plasmid) [Nocardia sp. CA-084685]|uniref:glycosyl hydrolase family 28-related protein n=1 Tax=Nocardia sp. CA-084685 TaxID=3239970 RepID=UPI003D98AB26
MFDISDEPSALWRPVDGAVPGDANGWHFSSTGVVSHPGQTAKDPLSQTRRTKWVSQGKKNIVAGIVSTHTICWRGTQPRSGGFCLRALFGLGANPIGGRAFCGLSARPTDICAVNPRHEPNTIGFGFDESEPVGYWYFITRGSGSTSSKTRLDGSSGTQRARRNTQSLYEATIYAPPNSKFIYARLVDKASGRLLFNETIDTNLPDPGLFLYVHAQCGTGFQASPASFELASLALDNTIQGFYSVRHFGAAGDGKADDTDAIQAAIDVASCDFVGKRQERGRSGSSVYLPPGRYRITRPLLLNRALTVFGAGDSADASVIIADPDLDVVRYPTENKGPLIVDGEEICAAIALLGDTTGPAAGASSADYCTIRDVLISGAYETIKNPNADGIYVGCYGARLNRVWIDGFPRKGIYVKAVDDLPKFSVNCDGFLFEDCKSTGNGTHGYHILGDKANAGALIRCNATSNGDCGFLDESTLGISFFQCLSESNARFNYRSERTVGASTYVGCYGEANTPSKFIGPSIVVVGVMIEDITSDSRARFISTHGSTKPFHVINNYGALDGWYAGRNYLVGEVTRPTAPNGCKYECVHEGRSDLDYEPVWSTTLGDLTPDGGVQWKCVSTNFKEAEPSSVGVGGWPGSSFRGVFGWGRGVDPKSWLELTPVKDGRWQLAWWNNPPHTACSYVDDGTYPRHGAQCFPEIWVGDGLQERRIAVAHNGPKRLAGSVGFYSVGDLILNPGPTGPWAWRVGTRGGIPYAFGKASKWTPEAAYHAGSVITPSKPNGYVYRATLTAQVDAKEPEKWLTTSGATVPDGDQLWECWGVDHDFLEPLPQQAAGQPDSTATNIAELVADFNTLLTKLRAANVIAPSP